MANSAFGVVDVPETIRRRLCLVLDVDDLVAARRIADELTPWFSAVKVGLELFTAAGPEALAVFVDLESEDEDEIVEEEDEIDPILNL